MPLQSRFHALPRVSLAAPPRMPEVHHSATLHDPAISVLTDLHHSPVIVADHLDGVDTTASLLVKAGVHMAFVSDIHGHIIGMVSSEHLAGEAPMKRAMAAHVHHEELTLEDLMAPLAEWAVVDIAAIEHARVGDVVATLREQGQRYLFVTEFVGGHVALRGLFSARRIEHELQSPIDGDGHAHSFAELEARIR